MTVQERLAELAAARGMEPTARPRPIIYEEKTKTDFCRDIDTLSKPIPNPVKYAGRGTSDDRERGARQMNLLNRIACNRIARALGANWTFSDSETWDKRLEGFGSESIRVSRPMGRFQFSLDGETISCAADKSPLQLAAEIRRRLLEPTAANRTQRNIDRTERGLEKNRRFALMNEVAKAGRLVMNRDRAKTHGEAEAKSHCKRVKAEFNYEGRIVLTIKARPEQSLEIAKFAAARLDLPRKPITSDDE